MNAECRISGRSHRKSSITLGLDGKQSSLAEKEKKGEVFQAEIVGGISKGKEKWWWALLP